jgi:hypothetical protein
MLALLIIGWTALSMVAWAGQGSYRVNLALPVRGRPVSLALDSGQVSLSPSPGASGRLEVTGIARYALTRSRVSWRSTLSGVSVSSRCHQLTGPCSFDYAVAVPPGTATAIEDSDGQLMARGLTGRLTVQADSGNIYLSALSGSVRADDQSGNISGESLTSAELAIENQSGDISMTGLASRDVTVSNQSGNIILTFTRVPGRVQVSNQSGDITVVLPPGKTAYHVTASTSSGEQVVGVPTASSSRHVITVTDQSGNIAVLTR